MNELLEKIGWIDYRDRLQWSEIILDVVVIVSIIIVIAIMVGK